MTTITPAWTQNLKAIADHAAFETTTALRGTSTHYLVTVALPRLTEAGLPRDAVLAEIERRAGVRS